MANFVKLYEVFNNSRHAVVKYLTCSCDGLLTPQKNEVVRFVGKLFIPVPNGLMVSHHIWRAHTFSPSPLGSTHIVALLQSCRNRTKNEKREPEETCSNPEMLDTSIFILLFCLLTNC